MGGHKNKISGPPVEFFWGLTFENHGKGYAMVAGLPVTWTAMLNSCASL